MVCSNELARLNWDHFREYGEFSGYLTYGVVSGGLGVLDGSGDDGLGTLWAQCVGENLVSCLWGVVLGALSWIWSWRGINWCWESGTGKNRALDAGSISLWAHDCGQIDDLGDGNGVSGVVSIAGGLGDVLAAVVDGGHHGGLDGQGGERSSLAGDSWGGGHGLIESTAVVEAASMAVGIGGSESREEEGRGSGDVHVG